jgi:hypothetical protein
MGFGQKVDYRTNRTLDLDKTYKIIRVAVEEAGLECIRADDIVHSGVIDKPMYEHLLSADVAIADLSTSNENAIYELGVRHALRPHTTIVIAEKQFKFPFDLNSLLIRSYEHLGTGIDFEEADTLRKNLVTAIRTILAQASVDSPVYTFLPDLAPPAMSQAAAAPPAPPPAAQAIQPPAAPAAPAAAGGDGIFSMLLEMFQEAKAAGDFKLAKGYLVKLRAINPTDTYLIQQHALATYKIKPVTLDSLNEACQILWSLDPLVSGDPETLGLWGAIHKRLWDLTRDRVQLDKGIIAYERGFYLKQDHYTGINYAFMLDERAQVQADPEEATADRVIARRIRKQLITIVDDALKSMPKGPTGEVDLSEWYWLEATKLEALMGTGDPSFERAREELFSKAPAPWMKDATQGQLAKLQTLLEP